MRPIDGTRQVGLFTKRIQQALLEDEADIAVHSLKDLPTESHQRLTLAAVPARESVADCLVSPQSWTLGELPAGARVGTGSRRRAAQLLSLRPDLRIEPIRGNVQTRLAKLQAGEFDAIVLAEAGILRLELHELSRSTLPLTDMLPAPGQGALGIEVRRDDTDTLRAVAPLEEVETRAAVTAERQLLAALHGGCLAPIAALGRVEAGQVQADWGAATRLRLTAVVLAPDGRERIDQECSVPMDHQDWVQAAQASADRLHAAFVELGAEALIQRGR
jgi:hydroxymethylbilane synthase